MTDTRIEDRRTGFTKMVKEKDPKLTDAKVSAIVERMIDDSIASPQTGSQVWMNRPAGLNREQYMKLSTAVKALFTEDEIKAMSTQESADAFKKDPIAYLAKWGRYQEFLTKFLRDNP